MSMVYLGLAKSIFPLWPGMRVKQSENLLESCSTIPATATQLMFILKKKEQQSRMPPLGAMAEKNVLNQIKPSI